MAIIDQEALAVRAEKLEAQPDENGIHLALVHSLSDKLELDLHFLNANFLAQMAAQFDPDPADESDRILVISGGHRVRAGSDKGQVKVTGLASHPSDSKVLRLQVAPIGDYSTYKLAVNRSVFPGFDPLFAEIPFKFRPGCFRTNCLPETGQVRKPGKEPLIDYLAKDYDSFKHTLIAAMMERVPGWETTSEADLDQTLIDLFSAAADELSDYQDRVMNEAFLSICRKRLSLARHARLLDYHIHQGNQASTWLALDTADSQDFELDAGFEVWAGGEELDSTAVVFVSKKKQALNHLFNRIRLYSWEGVVPALQEGATSADLLVGTGAESEARKLEEAIREGATPRLLIQEELNPASGHPAGADPRRRQILRLLTGEAGAETRKDPITDTWYVHVSWRQEDCLQKNYCFTVECSGTAVEGISFFNGNLVEVFCGRWREVKFREEEELLGEEREYPLVKTEKWGVVCPLPEPVAYRETLPGGEDIPVSTLEVKVIRGIETEDWEERISLISSDESSEGGDHFIVETGEDGLSSIRFGNGVNGRSLPEGAEVRCRYQEGKGTVGNVGFDSLVRFHLTIWEPLIESVWNPLDVVNGRDPEPVAEIIRRVPEAYRSRQLRAVTLKDYQDRVEELDEVSRAAASYAWTGSWRTVRIAVDPVGTDVLKPELREKIRNHVEAVRLIGEDIEIRPPLFVPLQISVTVCLHPDYWPEHLEMILDREFSTGYLESGRKGFFHPDNWTFGQELYASQIIQRVEEIPGVGHVQSVAMKRWGRAGDGSDRIVDLRPNEIIHVENDPDHMEMGVIEFTLQGGRG